MQELMNGAARASAIAVSSVPLINSGTRDVGLGGLLLDDAWSARSFSRLTDS